MKYLLIGIGPGMGLSLARRFGRGGFDILMVARHADKLKDYEATLAAMGISAMGYAADIADTDAFSKVLGRIVAEHPDIEVLHYNASALTPATPSQIDLSAFVSDLSTNVVGAVAAVQAVFPNMKNRGHGALFFTGGGSALDPSPMMSGLGVGKAAMRNYVLSLAKECQPLGIHAATVTICGMVKAGTPFDPDLIAGEFWRLYQQDADAWEAEVLWQ